MKLFDWLRAKAPAPYRVVEYADGCVSLEEWTNTEVGGFYWRVEKCASREEAETKIRQLQQSATVIRITEYPVSPGDGKGG